VAAASVASPPFTIWKEWIYLTIHYAHSPIRGMTIVNDAGPAVMTTNFIACGSYYCFTY
jgi:hypothetical protein